MSENVLPKESAQYKQQQQLFEAIRKNDIGTVEKTFSRHGLAILKWEMIGRNVLQEAVESGHGDMVKILVKKGADINQTLPNGDTLLHLSVKRNLPQIARVLLDYGIDLHKKDTNALDALSVSLAKNLPDVARVIATHGNDVIETYQRVKMCQISAEENNMPEMQQAMEEIMDSIDLYDPYLMLYLAIQNNDHAKIVDALDRQVDPFALRMGKKKLSALHVAAKQRDVSALAMLLAKATFKEIDVKDQEGQTPLHYAINEKHSQNAHWLLFAGTEPCAEGVANAHSKGKPYEEWDKLDGMKYVCQKRWDSLPDVITQMQGEWHVHLSNIGCTFSRSRRQKADPIIPPVIMVRCFTAKAESSLIETFQHIAYEFDEVCLEIYEYLCSSLCPVHYSVDLAGLKFSASQKTFILKFKDDRGNVCEGPQLILKEDKTEASCDVDLSTKGTLALVCRTYYNVSRFSVGPKSSTFKLSHVPGLELVIPEGAFESSQDILIKVEELTHKIPDPPYDDDQERHHDSEHQANDKHEISDHESDEANVSQKEHDGQKGEEDNIDEHEYDNEEFDELDEQELEEDDEEKLNESFPLRSISHFLDIKSLSHTKLHKSLGVKIPLVCKNEKENSLVAIWFKKPNSKSSKGISKGGQKRKSPTAEDLLDEAFTQPKVEFITSTSRNNQQTIVSTKTDDEGMLVAAEVKSGSTAKCILKAVQQLYSRQQKHEMCIYAMAKRFLDNSVEVIVCVVSATKYDESLIKLQSDGYIRLKEPIIAYGINRETFLLEAQSTLKFQSENEAEVAYQIGGRQNYSTFILDLNTEMEAFCTVKIRRKKPHEGENLQVGNIHLDLSILSNGKRKENSKGDKSAHAQAKTSDQVFVKPNNLDLLLDQLATSLPLMQMRDYCNDLGLSRDEIIFLLHKRSLSQKDANLVLLAKLKSKFRSESDFVKRLFRYLESKRQVVQVRMVQKLFPLASQNESQTAPRAKSTKLKTFKKSVGNKK